MARKRVAKEDGVSWYTRNGYVRVRAAQLPLWAEREFRAARESLGRLSANRAAEMLLRLPQAGELAVSGRRLLDPESGHSVHALVPEDAIAPLWQEAGSPQRNKGLVLSAILCALRGKMRKTLLEFLAGVQKGA